MLYSLKHYLYIFLILLSFNISAQNINEQSLTSNATTIIIELESLEVLKLNTSAKKDNVFKLSYENFDNKKVPLLYQSGGVVYITAKSKEIILEGAQKNKYRAGQPNYPNYTISIPKGVQVKVIYDKGDFEAKKFQGNLELNLNQGKVNIEDFKGSVTVQSFSGKINCTLNNAKINIENSKGALVSKLVDKNLITTKNTIKGFYKSKLNSLTIKTVHAKVMLSTVKTQ